MKKAGIIEQTAPYACSYASSQQRAGTLRAGRILEAAQAYDRDFQRWLVGQIPQGRREKTGTDAFMGSAWAAGSRGAGKSAV